MANGNGNTLNSRFWVPMMVMLFVTCASVVYGILQASAIARLNPVCDQVETNTAALHQHERMLDVFEVKLQMIIDKQGETERRLVELVKGVNDLAKKVN